MKDQWSIVARSALKEALSAWNDGNVKKLGVFLTADVVFSSPYVEQNGGKVIGREAVVEWIVERRKHCSRREIIAILMGAETVTIFMKDDAGFVSWQLRATSNFMIEEIIDSHSVIPEANGD